MNNVYMQPLKRPQKYTRLNYSHKEEIITFKNNNKTISKDPIASHFSTKFKNNISVKTIYDIIKNEKKIREEAVDLMNARNKKRKNLKNKLYYKNCLSSTFKI